MVIMRHSGLIAVLLFVQLWIAFAQKKETPPKITGSYMARGEIVEKLEDKKSETGAQLIQAAFEENFDFNTKDASFVLWQSGSKMTFIEANDVGQTFRFNEEGCDTVPPSEWKNASGSLLIKGYETEDKRIRFFLRELFSIEKEHITEGGETEEFRGIDAKYYKYEFQPTINGIKYQMSVISYWTDENWETTSKNDRAPLGFKISKFALDKGIPTNVSIQAINIFAFVPDTVNKELFAARQGLVCEGRNQLYNFPDFKNITALSLHTDFVFPQYREFKSIDTWLDVRNLMLRVDLDHVADQQPIWMNEGRRFTSEITSLYMNAVFQMDIFQNKRNCSVYSLDDYDFDIQDLFDPRTDRNLWTIDQFLGYKNTTFTYTGMAEKRSIPCRVWQGIRKDWPLPSDKVTSLWEWCIYHELLPTDERVTFRDTKVPLINLEITILESPDVPEDTIQPFPRDMKLIHHFYDVVNEDPSTMDALAFDVARCYEQELRRPLEFQVNVTVTEDNAQMLKNATSDASFLLLWKLAICDHSDLPPYTLRVTRVTSTVYANALYVSFLLLDIHPNMDERIRNQLVSLADAYDNLIDSVDRGKLTIQYGPKGKAITMAAVKGSLQPPIDPVFILHETTTVPPTTEATTRGTRTFPTIVLPTTTPGPIKTTPKSDNTTPKEKTEQTSGTGLTKQSTATGTGLTKQSTATGTGSVVTETMTSPSGSSGLPTLPTTQPLKQLEAPGHSSGTVAAVTIVMLLVGITLGAGGTFYKFRGLPRLGRIA